MIVYKDIFKKLQEAGYPPVRVRGEGILSQSTIQNIKQGKSINLESIEKLCKVLRCRIEDVVEIRLDGEEIVKEVSANDEEHTDICLSTFEKSVGE